MNPFQRSEHRHDERSHVSAHRRFSIFGTDNNRVAGGLKAALRNRRTSRRGRTRAKQEHRVMGNLGDGETHLPFVTKVKRALGMQRQSNNKKRRSALV